MAVINKKYAVVKFLSDGTYSEIPTAWLTTDKDDYEHCWWPPRTVNSKLLIANYASPNYDTWIKYDVDIIKYCTSLESACKSAADATYYTTDEERLGRGRRQHVPYNRFSSEEEENEYDNCQTRKHNIAKKRPNTNAMVSTPPSCPDNFGSNNAKDVSQVNDTSEYNHVATYHYENENNATMRRSEDRTLRTSEGRFLKLDEIPIIIDDNIVAEWLRFARQRKKREDKEKENEHHDENAEPVNKQ